MATPIPHAKTHTTTSHQQLTDTYVSKKRKVTYLFKFTEHKLTLPYAAENDGQIIDPRPANERLRSFKHNHEHTFPIKDNTTIRLFLNSDAKAKYRKSPVYQVTPTGKDVFVTITEKKGKDSTPDTPVFVKTETRPDGSEVDHYSAVLTGDIWMRVSHKFTETEAKGYIPTGTNAGISEAVLSIYRVLPHRSAVANCSAQGTQPAHTIIMVFDGNENAADNITNFSLERDGLTRVHPRGYVALFIAAELAMISKLILKSCWRPMLGSILHRSGIGLDVNALVAGANSVKLLGAPSAQEKRLYTDYQSAKRTSAQVEKEVVNAQKAYDHAKNSPDKLADAQKAKDAADRRKSDSDAQLHEAKSAWESARDAHISASVNAFREALHASPLVRQVFDPWYMDANTRDNVDAAPNFQKTFNEKLHANHMHVTVVDS